MVWKQTHSISEVCLYMSCGKPFGKRVPKLNVHENFGSFYCFANAEGNCIHKCAEECIQEGVDHPSPGASRLEKQKGSKGWIVGCIVIQPWEGIYISCHKKHEMVVLLVNLWEKCVSFKGKNRMVPEGLKLGEFHRTWNKKERSARRLCQYTCRPR